ncbi:WD40 repeat-like protein [Marasmius fiardii PR-910]|nr:WD40 repeat-like protein [Marasmius fiardii PR-910]
MLPGRKPANAAEFEQALKDVQIIIDNEQQREELLESTGDNAQEWLDLFQLLVEYLGFTTKLRSWIFKIMVKLSRRSGRHPQCLTIQGVEKLGRHPVGGGAFGDVWKGRVGQRLVCLKVIRAFEASDMQQILKDYMQEANIWRQLNHQNLLPFMGIYYLDGQLCLVSPWMERGNLVQYLKNSSESGEDVDHDLLAHDVACGLSYLHQANIVHADLKGVNVLITPDLRACLADFGLSRVSATQLLLTETSRSKGTTRWLSPELLNPRASCHPSRQSDVYAYACVCYEIYTGRVPFYEMAEATIVLAIAVDKKRPSRPENCMELHDSMWDMMVECWHEEPSSRPTMLGILARILEMKGNRRLEQSTEWKDPAFTHIWNDPQLPPVIRAVQPTLPPDHNTHLPGQSQLHIMSTSARSMHPPDLLPSGNMADTGGGGPGRGGSGGVLPPGSQFGLEDFVFREGNGEGNSMKKRKQGRATNQRDTKRTRSKRHEDFGTPSMSRAIVPSPSAPSHGPSPSLYGSTNTSQTTNIHLPQLHPLTSDPQNLFAKVHPQPTGEVLDSDVTVIPTSKGRFPEDIQDISAFPPEFKKEGQDWFAIFNPEIKKELDIDLVHTFMHENPVTCVRFSPDGTWLATGCNGTAQIYDVKTGVKTRVFADEAASKIGDLYIRDVCFTPDNRYLIIAAQDKLVRVWDIMKKRLRNIFAGHQMRVLSLDCSFDGRLIASGSRDGTVRIWDMMDGTSKILTINDPDLVNQDSGVQSVAISPNGQCVAAGSWDAVVRIWNVNTGHLVERLEGHQRCVYSVAFTPDGLGLVSGSFDKTLKYWDLSALMMNGAISQEVQPNGSDGLGALVKRDGGKQSQCTGNFTGHKDFVTSVAVSHDGQWVVSGSTDRRVQFHDLQHGTVQCVLRGHKISAISVDLSRTGNMLATGSADRVARIWSYKTNSII